MRLIPDNGQPIQPDPVVPQMTSEEADADMFGRIDSVIEQMNKNPGWAMGDPTIAGKPSFGRAVAGIENGDYQGLEMLEFGAVRGSPAVSFTDEDGQRQVIKVTMPQWLGMIQTRDDARSDLRRQRELESKKQAFAGQFKALASRVGESQDPIVSDYLGLLYQMDPGMAMQGLQSFIKARSGREEYTVYRGTEMPASFAEQVAVIDDAQADMRMDAFGRYAGNLADQGRFQAAGAVNMYSTLLRPKGDRVTPRSMTLPQYSQQTQGQMSLALLIDAMRQGLVPGLSNPVQLPSTAGRIDPNEMNQFLARFNEVSGAMGWGPSSQADLPVILDAINRVRGGMFTEDRTQEVPSSGGRQTSQAPAQGGSKQQPQIGTGQRNALENIAATSSDPTLRRMLQSGNQMEMQAAFTRLKNLYEQSRRDPAVLARVGISKSDIEAVYSLLTQE